VGINYRLGVDGFALLDGAPPNRGLLDQIAALRWVRDNVAAFGGDPDQVTLVGESAGAMSAAALMTTPAARGLFRRAVLQSGAGHHARRPDAARKIAAALAGMLGVPATTQGFARVPIPDLIAAQARFTAEFAARPDPARWAEDGALSLPFGPCVDGDVLPARPIEAIAAGAGSDVAVLIGSNTDEFRLFTVPFGADQAMTAAGVGAMLAGLGVDAGRAMRVYSETAPGARPGEVFMAAMRDFVFRVPALRLAEARTAHGAGTFVYEFAWPSPCYDGRLGAAHALELAYVFDRLPVVRGTPVYGEHPPQTLADAMHRAWVDFIKTGEPGWPAYGDRRITLRFAEAPELTEDPAASQRTLWDGVR
jgi:para-nitrobenzyl esterase